MNLIFFTKLDFFVMDDVNLNVYNGLNNFHEDFHFQIHYLRIVYNLFIYVKQSNKHENCYYYIVYIDQLN